MGGLHTQCVFTIVDPAKFLDAVRRGEGLHERKPWTSVAGWLKRDGDLDVRVFVADASAVGELLFCARIGRLVVNDEGTTWWPRDARWIAGRHKTGLTVAHTGAPISEGQIRPYVLCQTPAWVDDVEGGPIAPLLPEDSSQAREIFARIFPDKTDRRTALRRLAESIALAAAGSGQWGVTVHPQGMVRMNVGRTEVCILRAHPETRDGSPPKKDRRLSLLVAPDVVPARLRSRLCGFQYTSANAADLIRLGVYEAGHALAIREAHAEAIRAAHCRGYSHRRSHAPAVLAYIANETGRALPPPAWFSETTVHDASVHDALHEPDEPDALEGEARAVLRTHRQRERGLRAEKIAAVMASGAPLDCEVCGYNFGRTWGEAGDGYIEVHHLRPLGARDEGERTALSELALLCANCHAMAHRGVSAKGEARDLGTLRRLHAQR